MRKKMLDIPGIAERNVSTSVRSPALDLSTLTRRKKRAALKTVTMSPFAFEVSATSSMIPNTVTTKSILCHVDSQYTAHVIAAIFTMVSSTYNTVEAILKPSMISSSVALGSYAHEAELQRRFRGGRRRPSAPSASTCARAGRNRRK